MYSTRCMTPADWEKVEHFSASEMNYPDSIGFEFMQWLDQVRTLAGVAMHPVSDHRPPERNAKAGGASQSAHMDVPCDAIDIGKRPTPDDPNWNRHRFKIIQAAMRLGCTRIGIYPSGSLHLDRAEKTHPAPRLWVSV